MSREVFDLNKIGYNFIYFGASQPLFAMLEPGAPLRLRAPEHAALAPGGPQTRPGTPQHYAQAAKRGWCLLVVVARVAEPRAWPSSAPGSSKRTRTRLSPGSAGFMSPATIYYTSTASRPPAVMGMSQKKRYTFFESVLQALFGGVARNAIHQILCD